MSTPLINEELMKPRYEVIADYPEMTEWEVGEILDRNWGWDGDDVSGFKKTISDYPHLFRKLSWWEHREESEMPKYVKIIKDYSSFKDGSVYEYCNWMEQAGESMIGFIKDPTDEYGKAAIPADDKYIMPATKEEFEAYQNKTP